jgi:hypothetical protein
MTPGQQESTLRAALEALIKELRDESRELQSDFDARSRQVARSKGLWDAADKIAALLPAFTRQAETPPEKERDCDPDGRWHQFRDGESICICGETEFSDPAPPRAEQDR